MSEDNKKIHYLCLGLYIVYGLSCVMQFSPMAILVATGALTLALVIAHIGHSKSKGTLYETHFQWLVRTFWIGGAVYMPVITVMAAIIIFSEIDQTAVKTAVEAGETSFEALALIMVRENASVFSMVYFSLFLPFTGWWVYRCVSGVRRLMKGEAVPDPERWI